MTLSVFMDAQCSISNLALSSYNGTSATITWQMASTTTPISFTIMHGASSGTGGTYIGPVTLTPNGLGVYSFTINGLPSCVSQKISVAVLCVEFGNCLNFCDWVTTPPCVPGPNGNEICPLSTTNYESNNTSATAAVPTVNFVTATSQPEVTTRSYIQSSGDQDWFYFSVNSTYKNIKVTINHIPFGKDFNFALYSPSGTLVQTGSNSTPWIIQNNATNGTWRLRVFSPTNMFDANTCYSFTLQVGTQPWALKQTPKGSTNEPSYERLIDNQRDAEMEIVPNPAQNKAKIHLFDNEDINSDNIKIFDTLGRDVTNSVAIKQDENLDFELGFETLPNDTYIIFVEHKNSVQTSKIVIQK